MSQLDELECRQETCKVAVYYDEKIDPDEFEIAFFRKMAELGKGRIRGYQKQINGKTKNYFFMSPIKHSQNLGEGSGNSSEN